MCRPTFLVESCFTLWETENGGVPFWSYAFQNKRLFSLVNWPLIGGKDLSKQSCGDPPLADTQWSNSWLLQRMTVGSARSQFPLGPSWVDVVEQKILLWNHLLFLSKTGWIPVTKCTYVAWYLFWLVPVHDLLALCYKFGPKSFDHHCSVFSLFHQMWFSVFVM